MASCTSNEPEEGQAQGDTQSEIQALNVASSGKPDPVYRVEAFRVNDNYQKLDYFCEQLPEDVPKFVWRGEKDGENIKGYRTVFTVSRSNHTKKDVLHESAKLVPPEVKGKFEDEPKIKRNEKKDCYTVKIKKHKKDKQLTLKPYI